MKAIKKINNNVAFCVDGNGKELVAFGKGIGFSPMPYEITDLSKIDRTFYSIDSRFLPLFQEIPAEIFEVSAEIVDEARQSLSCALNPNLLLTMADHINFAIIRLKKYKKIQMQFSYDIEQMYPKETKLGRKAVKLIRNRLGIVLPESEITNIAMQFINAEEEPDPSYRKEDEENIIENITQMIEDDFHLEIARDSYNYNRFQIHMRYFLKRMYENQQIDDGCQELLDSLVEQEGEIYESAIRITEYLNKIFGEECTSDELLYLMLHIHRIVNR